MSWLKDAIQICDKSTWEFNKKNCQQLFDEWNKKEHSISQRAAMTLINRTRYTFEVNTDVHGGQA